MTGIVLLLFLAVLCLVGAVIGADWSRWFFTTGPGITLWVAIGLLIIAGLCQFNEIYTAKWPLAVYLGALMVLAGGLISCSYTVFAGYIIGCIGLFGLFRVRPVYY